MDKLKPFNSDHYVVLMASVCVFSVIFQLCAFFTTGDFKPLKYEVFSSGTSVTVAEVTKGRGNLATFTLLWAGVPTKPITFNATESEVCHKPSIEVSKENDGRGGIILQCMCLVLFWVFF